MSKKVHLNRKMPGHCTSQQGNTNEIIGWVEMGPVVLSYNATTLAVGEPQTGSTGAEFEI